MPAGPLRPVTACPVGFFIAAPTDAKIFPFFAMFVVFLAVCFVRAMLNVVQCLKAKDWTESCRKADQRALRLVQETGLVV